VGGRPQRVDPISSDRSSWQWRLGRFGNGTPSMSICCRRATGVARQARTSRPGLSHLSSIYGGNLPTTPWTTDAAWTNSLFEDNAEFGLGLRIAADPYFSGLVEAAAVRASWCWFRVWLLRGRPEHGG
jgi:hypothetical protein